MNNCSGYGLTDEQHGQRWQGRGQVLFARLFSRWTATGVAIFTIAIYALLVGTSPAVVRAAIMSSLAMLAYQLGRRSAGMNTLAITAGAMCLFNPNMPWDVSFQLS